MDLPADPPPATASDVPGGDQGDGGFVLPPLKVLETQLEALRKIPNPLDREYRLQKMAQDLNLDVEQLRSLLQAHKKNQDAFRGVRPLLRPLTMADRTLGDLVKWFEQLSLLQLANVIGQLTLLLALVSYVVEAPKRRQLAINDARDVIYERSDQPFSTARLEAFQFLNASCVPIIGFNAAEASMPGLKLDRCYQWQLNHKAFQKFPFEVCKYTGANLSNINLMEADLSGAVLTGANFEDANLAGVTLDGAILTGANFQGANLEGARLNNAKLEGAIFDGANLKSAHMNRSLAEGASFQNADLSGATLAWSAFPRAQFARANLQGVNFSRANLLNADFYKANLAQSRLRHADLRQHTNLREAVLTGADLRSARLSSADQVYHTKGWEQAIHDSEWQQAINQPAITPKIGLVVSSSSTIFDSYQKGMGSLSQAKIITATVVNGNEAQAVQNLIAANVQAILMRPEDPEESVKVIKQAYQQGVAVINIGECINPKDAERFVFGCYESNSFKMGYESSQLMIERLQKDNPKAPMKLLVLDGTSAGRLYPYFQGFRQALWDSDQLWEEVASSSVRTPAERGVLVKLIQDHPQIEAIWSGSNGGTELAVSVLQELGRSDVMVFGILDLTPTKAQMLLDPQNPLQSIVDQNPIEVGVLATERALTVLRSQDLDYHYTVVPYRVLSQEDGEAVQEALRQMEALEP